MKLDTLIINSSQGGIIVDCRTRMEIESTEEAIQFITEKELESEAPHEEYVVQLLGL